MKTKLRSGFTLIEVMVAVSIIGILVSIGGFAFINAQKISRDSARQADIKAIQSALEQYYLVNESYPTNATCSQAMTTDYFTGPAPTDPKDDSTYYYDISCDSSGFSYCVCANLENDGGNSAADCNFGGGDTHYCLTNQQ